MLALPHGAAATAGVAVLAAEPDQRVARADTARDAPPPQSAPCPDRRRHAGSRTSCAGSGGRRRRQSTPGWSARPAHSCSRRPCRPARRARARPRKSRGCPPRTLRGSTDTSPSAPTARCDIARALARRSARSTLPVAVASGHDHPQPGHGRARRVGPVRRRWDQDDVAAALADRALIGADRHQAGELPLRAGIRLQYALPALCLRH